MHAVSKTDYFIVYEDSTIDYFEDGESRMQRYGRVTESTFKIASTVFTKKSNGKLLLLL